MRQSIIEKSGKHYLSSLILIFDSHQAKSDQDEVAGGLFRPRTMAGLVACELASHGNFEMAVRLYEMAGKYNLALKHLSILLAQVVLLPTVEGSLRVRLGPEAQRFSQALASDGIKVEPKMGSSFVLVLIFFNLFHKRNLGAALEQLQRTRLMPSTTD